METGNRLAKRIIDPATKRPSKVGCRPGHSPHTRAQWWVAFRKRKFMGECFEVIQ